MLRKGFKDEEEQKRNEVFDDLLEWEMVPDLWEKEQRKKLTNRLKEKLDLELQSLENSAPREILEILQEKHFQASNYEKLGDLFLKMAEVEPVELESSLAQKALALYQYSQQESKTFSFSLIQKMNDAKSLI
ncbi:hypothetical protein RM553_04610 [Zunongwangia sp. F363]|uniref:Uncharacterized protein n=1 Tax=Autumnicola tepida TaxID=3075595 RepID=A0ABU3C716_9FLAO|nr:hypothetical protein [Zunongwangia sp. F363]MDT0642107.1 hypothetical protein [Zunongwangia sp. F363]